MSYTTSLGEVIDGHAFELVTNCFGRFQLNGLGSATKNSCATCIGNPASVPDRTRVLEALQAVGFTAHEWTRLIDDAEQRCRRSRRYSWSLLAS
jgi:hypothetical protein